MPEERESPGRRGPQLQSLNEKIARLAAISPWSDIYRSFSATAQLAGDDARGGSLLAHDCEGVGGWYRHGCTRVTLAFHDCVRRHF